MQIVNYKKNMTPNSVRKAGFTLKITKEDLERLGPLLVESAYFEKDNGQGWINWAGKEYTSPDGRKKNWNMVKWECANVDEVNAEVRGLVKRADMPAPVSSHGEDLPF